jgi:hypothetical protein
MQFQKKMFTQITMVFIQSKMVTSGNDTIRYNQVTSNVRIIYTCKKLEHHNTLNTVSGKNIVFRWTSMALKHVTREYS